MIPSSKPTWLAGKPPFLIGDTSSNGGFPIAILVYQSVVGSWKTAFLVGKSFFRSYI